MLTDPRPAFATRKHLTSIRASLALNSPAVTTTARAEPSIPLNEDASILSAEVAKLEPMGKLQASSRQEIDHWDRLRQLRRWHFESELHNHLPSGGHTQDRRAPAKRLRMRSPSKDVKLVLLLPTRSNLDPPTQRNATRDREAGDCRHAHYI